MEPLNVLLVEDEPGIRRGLASFLQLKGYRVVAADSCEHGMTCLAEESFDLVITDWHLGDALGEAIVSACECPAVVISGVTERVEVPGATIEVLQKPVLPFDLLATMESMVSRRGELTDDSSPSASVDSDVVRGLPIDARDRVGLIMALVNCRHGLAGRGMTVVDDGVFVNVQFTLEEEDGLLHTEMMRIGGDVRCLNRGGRPLMDIRFLRDGRRDEADAVVGPFDAWPEGTGSIAVDFADTEGCSPARMEELVHRVSTARDCGRSAYLLNVPGWLRLHLEILGKAHAMPNREVAGPRLPEVLSELWR